VKYEALAFSSAVARQAGTLYDAHKKARFERNAVHLSGEARLLTG